MRYFIRFAYYGTDFHGSQSQPGGGTVQDTLEQAFSTILRCPIPLTFAGRTDAGVHAEMMWAHFDYKELPDEFTHRLNRLLPNSIAIREIVPVTDTAHARFDAIARTYEYRTTCAKDPFGHKLRTLVTQHLDISRMNEAAKLLLGRQDFSSFCRTHTDVKTKFCTVSEAQWFKDERGNATFRITADRFLRNMVRAIVGTLFEVGKGRMSIEDFQYVIQQKNRQYASQSADAQGLYLIDIQYPSSIFIPNITNNTLCYQ